MCVAYFTGKVGLSIADVTTGDYYVTEVEDAKKLLDEINKYHPSEIICNDAFLMSGVDIRRSEKPSAYHGLFPRSALF